MDNIQSLLAPTQFGAVQSLPPDKQQQFFYEFHHAAKNPTTALILAIFGFHYIYLGQIGKFIAFFLTGGGLLIWWLYDLVTITKRVRQSNEQAADALIMRLK